MKAAGDLHRPYSKDQPISCPVFIFTADDIDREFDPVDCVDQID
jgi:hypothetical protein